jgi:hypothetical protein
MKVVKPVPHQDLGEILDGRMKRIDAQKKAFDPKAQERENLHEMARNSYGYGRWDSPYWFIGPEQGMGEHERSDLEQSLEQRCRCWGELGGRELNDCREFHRCIREVRWHFKSPKVNLQSTWRPLMLLLMTFLHRPADRERLRIYQRDRWGMLDGETCLIELSGLAAPNAEEATDTSPFLRERIQRIREKIREHRPRLVVMYGLEHKTSYEQIAERQFPAEPAPFFCKGPTLLVMTPHPVSRIREGNEYWTRLGSKLRG